MFTLAIDFLHKFITDGGGTFEHHFLPPRVYLFYSIVRKVRGRIEVAPSVYCRTLFSKLVLAGSFIAVVRRHVDSFARRTTFEDGTIPMRRPTLG